MASFFRATPVYECKFCLSIVMTIVCLILSLTSYLRLAEISADLFDITDNWKTIPVTEMYVAMVCDDGDSAIGLQHSTFPGVGVGSCGCGRNLNLYVSTVGNCSAEAEATVECESLSALSGEPSKSWRHANVCFRREGEAAAVFKPDFVRRPTPDKNGLCPTGYKKCGSGNYDDDLAMCVETDGKCPITAVVVSDTVPTTGGTWQSAGTFDGPSLYVRRDFVDESGAVDLRMDLTRYDSDNYLNGNYNSAENDRGPCYFGGAQRFPSSRMDPSETSYWSWLAPSYESMCSREDQRYILFDKLGLTDHFIGNLANADECDGFSLVPTSDPTYNPSLDPDYVHSGVPCTVQGECTNPGFASDCTESICETVQNQNTCGVKVQSVRSLASDSNSFGMYQRPEIKWRTDCGVTMGEIYSELGNLKGALAAQLAGVIIAWILGLTLSICLPCWGLSSGENRRINVKMEVFLMQAEPVQHVCRIAPLIPSLIFTGSMWRMFEIAGNDKCSDDLTNNTISFLGKTMPEIYRTTIANFVIEGCLMAFAIYTLRSYWSQQNKTECEVGVEMQSKADPLNYAALGVLEGVVEPVAIVNAKPISSYGAPPSEAPPPYDGPPSGAPPTYGAPPSSNTLPRSMPGTAPLMPAANRIAPAMPGMPGMPAMVAAAVPSHLAVVGSGAFVEVMVPPGASPGAILQVQVAGGAMVQFTIPPGVPAHTVLRIQV
ncbi:hypothetical protein B484DRAFT_453993 [Ochromonadaceae sp. CCMP2298]|nr:hypothetical protein B484DRAFT_453993 [Ochromonadaceae sp. CCMP2298]|mmetsp:Transcript_17608/g.39791  ORF Transcript_17608/g.39791 Transcript_17608/m.39791 type:complete len:716 (-) Transcript_17608:156-2303(-)